MSEVTVNVPFRVSSLTGYGMTGELLSSEREFTVRARFFYDDGEA